MGLIWVSCLPVVQSTVASGTESCNRIVAAGGPTVLSRESGSFPSAHSLLVSLREDLF